MALIACWLNCSRIFHGSYLPRRLGVWRSPNQPVAAGHWGFPRWPTGWLRQAAKMLSRPIFGPTFCRRLGFRPRRTATHAMEAIRVAFLAGLGHAFEANIRDFFGSIDHDRLMVEVGGGCRIGGC